MNPLDRLEQSIERLFEGTAGAIFRQSLKPAELGKRLEQAMRDGRQVSVGKTIVPNRFIARLHPDDFAPFEPWLAGLTQEMASYLLRAASERGYSFIYQPAVTIVADPAGRRRIPRIEASIAEASPRPAPQPERPPMMRPVTQPSHDYEQTTPIRSWATPERTVVLRCVAGEDVGLELRFPKGESSIGRSRDRDAILNSMRASRNHARIRVVGSRAFLADAGSTHGTFVNGEQIHREIEIVPGDRVRMGGHEFDVALGDSAGQAHR